LTFEWDENKNNLNKQKHKISFENAVKVFLDKKRIDCPDEEHSLFEERRYTIGMVDSVLFVVYTERNENTRLISARKSTTEETNEYYRNYDIR